MKRRIYHALCFVAFSALLVSTAVSLSLFYHFYEKQNQENLATLCQTTAAGLQMAQEPQKWLKEQAKLDPSLRITFLDTDGQVLYDSQADDGAMENHKNRPEIRQALTQGFGEDSRLSNTLGESTYYYAVQLSESGMILRLSRNLQNMLGAFLQVLPFEVLFSLLLFLLSLFCSQIATRRIVIPLTKAADHLEQLPLEGEYEELAPFLRKIQNQNDTIRQQLDAIREEKERVTAILSNTQEGLVLCDRSGQILSVNESALSILSPARKDQLEGKHYVYLTRNQQLAHAINAAEKGANKSGLLALEGKFYRFFANPVKGNGQGHWRSLIITRRYSRA